jgi:hypothetical protein
MGLPHVDTVQQIDDDTLVVYVQADNFSPGQEVEVSVYLTQDDAYAAYNDKKRVPFPDPDNPDQPTVLPVELPKTKLNANEPVTVITRVSEVWPSVLQPDGDKLKEYQTKESYPGQGLKALWTYEDTEGK